MPAPPLSNTFETQLADTTAITAANSDDGTPSAGSAFTAVVGAPVYSTDHAKSGSLSMKYDTTATYVQKYVDWQTLGAIADPNSVWFRFYFYATAFPSGTGLRLFFSRTSSGNCGGISLDATTGVLHNMNAAASGINPIGTVAIALNQWIRIECRVQAHITAGQVESWLYNTPEAPIASFDDHILSTGQVLGASVDQCRFGGAIAAGPNSYISYYDDVAVSTSGQIGPSTVATTHDANIEWLHF